MKRSRSNGETVSSGSQVFESSGWLSPRPFAESANEHALKAPQTSTTITGLEPYTQYEFRVSAVNVAGSVSSAWTSERTGESGEDQALNSTFKTHMEKYCLKLKSTALK